VDEAWLSELSELLRIPSVSADPVHAPHVREAAEWVAEFVRRAGGTAEVQPGDTHPLVVGEIRASDGTADAPTILVYGHFDVQPPAPLELWESEPFEATVRGEWLYARGVADDKGQLWTLLKGAELLAAEGRLPVNLRFACDGEEEVGGRAIVDFLEQDERGADACIIFDSSMERRGVPAVCTATRGVMSFELAVRTGERDLHSGMYGNAALNATHALAWALNGILPRDGRLPDALREGAQAPTDEERASWSELTPGADVLREAGAIPNDAAAADDFYLRTTAGPSVDVNGILGGKPGLTNTTIPVAAQANFSVRIAPGQDVETIRAAVDRLVRESAPDGADVSLELVGFAPPGLVSPDEPAVQIALDAFEHVTGRRPLLARSGGTLPIVPALVDQGIPTILSGIALPESNIHSPNERVLLEYLPLGVELARELYTRLAALR
jgi:acetylornithine deacetylase/succinyl-diaminopimelate desuccinylase-like protein